MIIPGIFIIARRIISAAVPWIGAFIAAKASTLLNGGNKNWDINPYKNLGKTALENCDHDFKIGSFGAGTGATTANLKGGLGSASLILDKY